MAINSGVVEIRYNIGVNVRLEGPAVFEVNGLNTGLLWFGKMTARSKVRTRRMEFPAARLFPGGQRLSFGRLTPAASQRRRLDWAGRCILPGRG